MVMVGKGGSHWYDNIYAYLAIVFGWVGRNRGEYILEGTLPRKRDNEDEKGQDGLGAR